MMADARRDRLGARQIGRVERDVDPAAHDATPAGATTGVTGTVIGDVTDGSAGTTATVSGRGVRSSTSSRSHVDSLCRSRHRIA